MSIFGSVSGTYSEDPNKIDAETDLTSKSLQTWKLQTALLRF